jgi:hypothetical protein
MPLHWEVDLSPHPCSQPLFLLLPLLTESLAPLGGFVTPPLLSVLVSCWLGASLAPCPTPILQGWFSNLPCPTFSGRLQFTIFQFYWGEVQSAHKLHWIMFPAGRVVCSITCWDCRFTPVGLGTGRWGEMTSSFSQSRPTMGLCLVQCMYDVCMIRVQYIAESC